MGRIIIQGGGNNVDLDIITAAASDVLKGKVIIGPDGEPLTGTIPSLSARTITPGTGNQVLNAGNYLAGNITVVGDADLIADNIKSGKNIFNVAGTCKEFVRYSNVLTSSSSSKKFTGDNPGTLYYISVNNLGFTPMAFTAVTEYTPEDGVSYMTNYGAAIVTGGSAAFRYSVNSYSKTSSLLEIPVYTRNDRYNVLIVGYK